MGWMDVLPDRVRTRIQVDSSGCWIRIGKLNQDGYGSLVQVNGRQYGAHRAVWLLVGNPDPGSLDLDHLCRVRRCVNPDHLEAVTRKENCRRGDVGIQHRIKTHCPQGHPYSGENLRILNRSDGRKERICRTCYRERQARFYAKKKAVG